MARAVVRARPAGALVGESSAHCPAHRTGAGDGEGRRLASPRHATRHVEHPCGVSLREMDAELRTRQRCRHVAGHDLAVDSNVGRCERLVRAELGRGVPVDGSDVRRAAHERHCHAGGAGAQGVAYREAQLVPRLGLRADDGLHGAKGHAQRLVKALRRRAHGVRLHGVEAVRAG